MFQLSNVNLYMLSTVFYVFLSFLYNLKSMNNDGHQVFLNKFSFLIGKIIKSKTEKYFERIIITIIICEPHNLS